MNNQTLPSPRSQTLFGNAPVSETPFRPLGNRVAKTTAFPNRVWERGTYINPLALIVLLAVASLVSANPTGRTANARAAGGSVAAYISKQPKAETKIIAEAGNIELRLPATVAVTVDAACSAGRLSSDFSLLGHQVDDPGRLKGTINGGGPLVLLRASAGNISLRK
jgi:hypothetical protein